MTPRLSRSIFTPAICGASPGSKQSSGWLDNVPCHHTTNDSSSDAGRFITVESHDKKDFHSIFLGKSCYQGLWWMFATLSLRKLGSYNEWGFGKAYSRIMNSSIGQVWLKHQMNRFKFELLYQFTDLIEYFASKLLIRFNFSVRFKCICNNKRLKWNHMQ